MQYEYKIETPSMSLEGSVVNTGKYETIETKKLFGGTRREYVDKTITETEWLNLQGLDGWELVNVFRNSMTYNIKEYYFKRSKKQDNAS